MIIIFKNKGIILFFLLISIILVIVVINNETLSERHVNEVEDNIEVGTDTDVTTPTPSEQKQNQRIDESINGLLNLPETPLFSKRLHFVAIGDSITRGVGDETKQFGYVGLLKKQLNSMEQIVTIDNHGVTGNRSDQLLTRLGKEEIVEDIATADTVLITIGANDILQLFKENFLDLQLEQFEDEQDEYRERLTDIIETIKGINERTSIYLIGFYNPFKTFFTDIDEVDYIVDYWNNIGYEVTTEFDHVYYIPTKDLYDGPAETYLSEDNFHLNHDGYQKMAVRILESLQKNEGITYEQFENNEE